MKKLELNQMENLDGGVKCSHKWAGFWAGAVTYSWLAGPVAGLAISSVAVVGWMATEIGCGDGGSFN